MAGTAAVRRPTEYAAGLKDRPLPPVYDLKQLLAYARTNNDRYGTRLFTCLLYRALGGVR